MSRGDACMTLLDTQFIPVRSRLLTVADRNAGHLAAGAIPIAGNATI